MLEEGLKNVKTLKSIVNFTDGSILRSESSEEIPSALSSVIHPPVNPIPVDEAYQLLQSQLALKAQNQLIPSAMIQPTQHVQMLPQNMVVQPPTNLQLQTYPHLPVSTLPQTFHPQLFNQQTIPFSQQMQFVQTSQGIVNQPIQQRNINFQTAIQQSIPGQSQILSPTTHMQQTSNVLGSAPYSLPMLASQSLGQLSNQMHFQQPVVGQASTINPLLFQQQGVLLQQQQMARFPAQVVMPVTSAMPRMVASIPQHTQSSNNSNNIVRLDFVGQRFVQNPIADQDMGLPIATSLDSGSGGSGDVASTKPP